MVFFFNKYGLTELEPNLSDLLILPDFFHLFLYLGRRSGGW